MLCKIWIKKNTQRTLLEPLPQNWTFFQILIWKKVKMCKYFPWDVKCQFQHLYVLYVLLEVEHGFMRFANNSFLFLSTFLHRHYWYWNLQVYYFTQNSTQLIDKDDFWENWFKNINITSGYKVSQWATKRNLSLFLSFTTMKGVSCRVVAVEVWWEIERYMPVNHRINTEL